MNQATHSSIASSTSSTPRHGPSRRTSSVFVQANERLGQSVVVGVALAPDRWLDASIGQPLGVAIRQVLDTSGAVTNPSIGVQVGLIADHLLERVPGNTGPELISM